MRQGIGISTLIAHRIEIGNGPVFMREYLCYVKSRSCSFIHRVADDIHFGIDFLDNNGGIGDDIPVGGVLDRVSFEYVNDKSVFFLPGLQMPMRIRDG